MSETNLGVCPLEDDFRQSMASMSSLPSDVLKSMLNLILADKIGDSTSALAKTLRFIAHDGNASPMGIAYRRCIGIGGRWQRRGLPVVVAERLNAISLLLGFRRAELTAGTIDASQAFLARHMGDMDESVWHFLWHETERDGAGTDWESVGTDSMADGSALYVSATFGTALEMYGNLPDIPGVYAFGYPSLSGGSGLGMYKIGMSEVSVMLRVVEELADATRTVMSEDAVIYRVWVPNESEGDRFPMRIYEKGIHGCLETRGCRIKQRLNGKEWYRSSLSEIDDIAKGNGLNILYAFDGE